LCQCWSYFFHWFNIDKILNVLVLYQCHFRTCCYNVILTSYYWLYQHWTLNILLRCCKSTHTKRGQVCDVSCNLHQEGRCVLQVFCFFWLLFETHLQGFFVYLIVNYPLLSLLWEAVIKFARWLESCKYKKKAEGAWRL
jgi:hypothetical protein